MTVTLSSKVRRPLAAAGGVAFLGAGALTVAPAWIRWHDTCGPGLDTEACVIVQDHRFDYLLPSEPWEPIGATPLLIGLAHVLLAVGLTLLFAVDRSPAWARLLQAVLVGSVLGVAIVTLASAALGHPIGCEWVGIPLLLSPLIVATLLVEQLAQDVADWVMPGWAWCGWAIVVVLANPLLQFVLTTILLGGYESYDTPPWDGLLSGAGFVVAGLIVLAGPARTVTRQRRPAQR